MIKTQEILSDLCEKKGITLNRVSDGIVSILSKDKKVKYIFGYKFDLNSYPSSVICDDKYALYCVLKRLNIPVCEHHVVYQNYNIDDVFEYFNKYNKKLIIKSNTGTFGTTVYFADEPDRVISSIEKILSGNSSLSISPYYHAKNQYRVVLLDSKAELVYKKINPIVHGDGAATLRELLCNFNNYYFSNADLGASFDQILEKGEEYTYSFRFSLSEGASAEIEENIEKKKKIVSLAKRAAKALNLRLCNVDVIELYTGEYLIIDIGTGMLLEKFMNVCPEGKYVVNEIYDKILDKMFK